MLYRFLQGYGVTPRIGGLPLVLEDEGDHQRDAVVFDFAVFDVDFLVFDPSAFDIFERLAGTGDAFVDGIVKAFFAGRDDFGNAGD